TAGLPSAALRDAAGALWMLVADSNMANALLYRIPQHGAVELVELPANADPVELAEAGDTVLVADVRNFRIHRFSSDGARLQDFGSVHSRRNLPSTAPGTTCTRASPITACSPFSWSVSRRCCQDSPCSGARSVSKPAVTLTLPQPARLPRTSLKSGRASMPGRRANSSFRA